MNSVARLEGVTLRYKKTSALDDISLDIPAGCMVGLIGPDGVGKSSLLALLAGVRKIQIGTVQVLGCDMNHSLSRRAICPSIAYMPQGLGHNLYMTLSVFENIDFFGRLFGQSREERSRRIDELLESTGLTPFADRPAGKLSGGMKQKLGLCCALIHDPQLLILDEPTTGVDPLSRRQFWELIERIRQRHQSMSVIVATAYMDEAERFDWLVAMDGGKILARGTPEQLKLRTDSDSLDKAFIQLLPEQKRRGYRTLTIPPRQVTQRMTAIETRGLSRSFGDFIAVDKVSFTIEAGEIFGFLGSNGCGKTTTMKMLTGLLPSTAGEAKLFGQSVDSQDINLRKRVGYMSQSFSLYSELTVRQNLMLHARIFQLPEMNISTRLNEVIDRFGLSEVINELAEKLPLGVRQRLSLAVAIIHNPDVLILDEPTSGVDPIARDQFWELLIKLSRDDGVTIFISTHFMNEAARCDRISLMHAGRVLAQGSPSELNRARGTESLEETFIAYLEEVPGSHDELVNSELAKPEIASENRNQGVLPAPRIKGKLIEFSRSWAYARRESLEIIRDPIRISFALIGPIILMIAFGYGISFDLEDISYSVLDQDQTLESRNYLENFSSSRYFKQRAPIRHYNDLENELRKGKLGFVIEIPPGFAKDLKRGRQPEVAIWLDGTIPFRAETSRSYILGVHQQYLERWMHGEPSQGQSLASFTLETRFRYNQDFKSVYAIVPGTIMMLLIWIPAMMTAAGIVREKEMGSITNLYASPVSGLEFLIGKQLPYVLIALINFACLLLLAVLLFQVPIKGNVLTLLLGGLLYVIATTCLGLIMSSFMKTQIAAIFGTAIITATPAVNFSGFFAPVASLTPGAQVFSQIFPSGYFQQISLGVFTKGLGFEALQYNFWMLMLLIFIYFLLSLSLLKTQER